MAEITWIENRPVHIGNLVILVGHYPKLRSVSPRHTFLTPFKKHYRTPRTDTSGQRYHEGNYHKVIKLPLTGNTFNEDTPTVQEIPMGIAVLVTRIASLMDRLVTNREIVYTSGGIDRGHKKWNMRLWWQILEQYDVLRSHWPVGIEGTTGLTFDEFNEFLGQAFPGWNQMGEETLSFPERRNDIVSRRLQFTDTPAKSVRQLPPSQAEDSDTNRPLKTVRRGGKVANRVQIRKMVKNGLRHQE